MQNKKITASLLLVSLFTLQPAYSQLEQIETCNTNTITADITKKVITGLKEDITDKTVKPPTILELCVDDIISGIGADIFIGLGSISLESITDIIQDEIQKGVCNRITEEYNTHKNKISDNLGTVNETISIVSQGIEVLNGSISINPYLNDAVSKYDININDILQVENIWERSFNGNGDLFQ